MDSMTCAKAMAAVVPDGERLLEEHLRTYEELLLHVYAGDVFTCHLLNCLETGTDAAPCLRLLERMWLEGDEAVRNVLDVTILERLSDEDSLWQAVGRQVSPEFRYIVNRVIMPNNGVFANVQPMEG